MSKNQVIRLGVFIGILGAMILWSGSLAAEVTPGVVINNNASQTKTRAVTLSVTPPKKAVSMKVSNLSDLSDVSWKPVQKETAWNVSYGSGTKTVYVRFKLKNGSQTEIYKDTIVLASPGTLAGSVDINKKKTETTSRYVTLYFAYSNGVEEVELSNTSNFETSETYPIEDSLSWVVSPGAGTKTVYARFTDVDGKTLVVSDTIVYQQPKDYIPEGTVVKSPQDGLYYVGFDGRLHPFGHLAVFHSWFEDFVGVKTVSNALIGKYQIGIPVCVRPGTWLVQFESFGQYYAVEPGCVLRPLRSDAEAYILYGPTWHKRVIQLPTSLQTYYSVKSLKAKSGTDKDGDGVDKETEQLYGTSESKRDSDNDAVSDYEEIYYWLSDPMNPDTDGDGYQDGQEIAGGFSPVGVGAIKDLTEQTYVYPSGSFVWQKEKKKVYYMSSSKKVYPVASSVSEKSLSSFAFPPAFVAVTPYGIDLGVGEKKSISSNSDEIQVPTVKKQSHIIPL